MFRQTAKRNALNRVLITGCSNCFFDHQKSPKRDSELLRGGHFSPIKLFPWFQGLHRSDYLLFYCVGFWGVSECLFTQLFPLIYRAINIHVSGFDHVESLKKYSYQIKYLNNFFFSKTHILHNADRYHSSRSWFWHNKLPTKRRTGSGKINADLRFRLFPVQITRAPSYVSFLVSPYQASNFVKKLIRKPTRKQSEGQKRAAAPSLSPSTEYQSLSRPTVWFLGTQRGEAEGFDFKFLDCLSRAKICCHHASGASVVFGSKSKSERTII